MRDLAEQRAAVGDWLERAAAAGWVDAARVAAFRDLEAGAPDDLFRGGARPLVVGLFGGTGVGKSSLLNRLVGAPLARIGVQRPTSYELTAYLHEDIDLADLPDELPADKLQTGRHRDDSLRDVLLLDMPDIDSTAIENRVLVFEWLARIDLLIYVVSPERYRDDIGWSVLRERGHRHGWVFVINHWDSGDPRQRDDLVHLLRAAGFDDPLVFCTACPAGEAAPLPSADELEYVLTHLRDLRSAHEIAELARLGVRARVADLRDCLDDALRPLTPDADADPGETWQRYWQRFVAGIREGVDFPIRSAAAQFARREGATLAASLRAVRGTPSEDPAEQVRTRLGELAAGVWDEWAETRVGEALDAFEVSLRRTPLTAEPYRRALQPEVASAGDAARGCIETVLRTALVRPGNVAQRIATRVLGGLTWVLPAAAVAWVAWGVVRGYFDASFGQAAYLGSAFAVHSLLLIAVAWLVPFGLRHLVRPSLEQTVARGLRAGVDAAVDDLATRFAGAFERVEAQRVELGASGREIAARLEVTAAPASPTVQRMVRRADPT